MPSITAAKPTDVATWIELQTHAAPTVKLRLAAIRHLFDWWVTGQVVPVNPAVSVRGRSHTVRTGKTPVLDACEARQLLDSIDVSTPAGPRNRARIAPMVFSFAQIGAARAMRVQDVYVEQRQQLPGGVFTHWKAPPFHGARHEASFARALLGPSGVGSSKKSDDSTLGSRVSVIHQTEPGQRDHRHKDESV